MDPISIVLSYVALKFLDQFIKEEGYGRIKKLLFPKNRYCNRLVTLIYETIDEHEKIFPCKPGPKFPFYHSQVLFEELNKYILFNTDYNPEDILSKIRNNVNINIPSSAELKSFYNSFVEKVNNDDKLNKLFIKENYKEKIFETYDLLKSLEIKLKSLEKSVSFIPTDEWFKNQCEHSIFDLGNRYTPELNYELEVSEIFEGLGRTEKFRADITKRFDQVLIKGRNTLRYQEEIKDELKEIESSFDKLYNIFHEFDFLGTSELKIDDFINHLSNTLDISDKIQDFYLTEERKLQEEKKDYQYYHKYGYEIRNNREFNHELSGFIDFLNSDIFNLAKNPFLLLDGEAGIGKSHMIGDIVSRRLKNNYESIFLLGQHFVTDEDPWVQIFKRLHINSNPDDFLDRLNFRGEESNKRILIFIDALNEGRGKYFWPAYLISFIKELKSLPWIGLVLTIRTSYKNFIFPDNIKNSFTINEHTLYGFRNVEYEASKLFFNNYNIELPSVPLLHPEFQNPLFLKLFCEGISKLGLTKIPDGLQGITSIIEFFLNSVNYLLSKPTRVNYSTSINIVEKSVEAIIQYKVENQVRYIPYEQAFEIIDKVASKYVTSKGFVDELLAEGVLSKNLFWNSNRDPEEGIYLAYERFEDHLISHYLLEKYPNLEHEFSENGNLFKYVKDEHTIDLNKGLIDAFSIQIPEKSGKELFDFLPNLKDKYTIVESFVESLLWRKIETVNEKSLDYVNEYVFSYQGSFNYFWETILSITSIPGHFFNAYSLHRNLMSYSLAERDAGWTQFLKYRFNNDSSVKRLIDWAWNETEKTHISDESIKLSSIALAWFHTSTNRQLRDCSTKALVSLLQNRIGVLIEILKLFENVNDPYVYERLFAVAYGCTLRTNQTELLSDLCEYIFQTMFKDKSEIYPHALLRDYARGVIEYVGFLGINLSFDLRLVRPPYKSTFSDKAMTYSEIEKKYKFDYKLENYHNQLWSQNAILSSMATEYGSGIGGYGDFGRYVFESALRSWKVDTNQLSNIAIEWIFEKYGYDVHKHGEYDASLKTYGRDSSSIERIGKKYQWIALHEMVARVSDNFKKYNEWSFQEDIEQPYQGPWDPSIRDIDPTILIKKTTNFSEEEESKKNWWNKFNSFRWDCLNIDWIKQTDDLPDFRNVVQIKDEDGVEWFVLEGYPESAEPKRIGFDKWDYPHKRIWCHIRSYLVRDSDFIKLKDWACEQNFMGRWMPESRDRHEIFSREYYWSPVHKYFVNVEGESNFWRDIHDNETGEVVSEVIVPTESFAWEEQFDHSKDETISFLRPSIPIYEGMHLKYTRNEGEFINTSDDLVCFATNIKYNSKHYFIIKKIPFIKYLEKNQLKVIWTILGEKQIAGGRMLSSDYVGRMEISGAYYLDNNKIDGKLNTKII